MNRDHAHSVFQRDAGLKHGADQPVGGCNAAGKGLPVQQFGDTVLDDDRDRIIGTAGEALPDIKTGWTNGVCDQSDMLRLLELCDQLQERQRQMAAVCDDLDVHIIQIIGSLDHACDPEAVFRTTLLHPE